MLAEKKVWTDFFSFVVAFSVLWVFLLLVIQDLCRSYCVKYKIILEYDILQKGDPEFEYCGVIKEKYFINRLVGYVIEEFNCILGSEPIVFMEKPDIDEVIEYLVRLGKTSNIKVCVSEKKYKEALEKIFKEEGIKVKIKICEF